MVLQEFIVFLGLICNDGDPSEECGNIARGLLVYEVDQFFKVASLNIDG